VQEFEEDGGNATNQTELQETRTSQANVPARKRRSPRKDQSASYAGNEVNT